MRENAVSSQIRLFAAQNGIELWRNNSGGFYDQTGRFVRYGLGSFLPQHNCASSDLIGIRPVLITPDLVGHVLGVFTAVETKRSDWKYSPSDKHTADQERFLNIVCQNGGFGGFARNINDFKNIVKI